MKRFASIVTAFIAAVAIVLSSSGVASAQSSAALSIVPKKNYTIESGKSIKDGLTIRNMDTEHTLNLTLNVVDFSYKDDGGTPDLMLAEDAPKTTWSLKDFMTLPKTVKIAPRESKTIDLKIAIPEKQGAGSYYSAIVYSSGSGDGGNVGLSASGVTLAFVNVPGTVKEDFTLQKFGAYRLATSGKSAGYLNFAINKPQNIAYTLKNDGNVAESPVGSITLRHMFGQEIRINDINPQSSLALRGQTRTFVSCIALKGDDGKGGESTERSNVKECVEPSLWPGFYTTTIDAYYGQNGNNTKEITGTSWFIYAPLWFLILLGILILAIAFAIWRIVSKTKNKKRSVKGKKSALRR